MRKSLLSLLVLAASATPALAEWQLSLYTGHQSAPHSTVSGSDPAGVGAFDFTAGWDGRSFNSPPYYGIRATHWLNERWGYSLDFTHSKVYANDETLASSGFERLEFTDGINTLTLSAVRRWQREESRWTPYVAGGLGVSLPSVESQSTAFSPRTFNYQYGGPVVNLQIGVEYKLNETWSLFGEYKGNYVPLDVDLDVGGSLETNLITNALNFGASYRF